MLEQALSRGNSLDTRHIRRQLGIYEGETIGGEQTLDASSWFAQGNEQHFTM